MWPALFGVLVAVVAWAWLPAPVEGVKEVVQSVVNTSAIAIGFLATSLSILYSIGRTRLMSDLQKLGRMKHIVNYFMESMTAWFVLAVLGGFLLLIDFKGGENIPKWGQTLLVIACGILAWSIGTLIRIVGVFRLVLNS